MGVFQYQWVITPATLIYFSQTIELFFTKFQHKPYFLNKGQMSQIKDKTQIQTNKNQINLKYQTNNMIMCIFFIN